ncbi:uncharacterized protein TNCV_4341301 [Trichonephila clavipes]|nr:uncharacterized protein TNCV_4341301 [Trichonephila clavipes]
MMHVEDFYIVEFRLECGRNQMGVSEEPGIIWLLQQLQDDGNVSKCYSTGHCGVKWQNGIWKKLPKEADGAQHPACIVSYL